ncbi:UNVERIFIED_CONTAM: hypothetical protein H355_005619 [Colinus virginianus]|nr:hypothetical protein H355_005619 [Colinus virginianus]
MKGKILPGTEMGCDLNLIKGRYRPAADPATEGSTERIHKVSNSVNSSKLSLAGKGICDNIQCKSEELVIREQGLYLIYCHLNFHFANCSRSPTDLKIELLINNEVNRQTLSTWCASDSCQEKNFKTLFQLHLTYLNVEDRISVTLSHPKFLNEIHLPNDNVLGVLRYSDEM